MLCWLASKYDIDILRNMSMAMGQMLVDARKGRSLGLTCDVQIGSSKIDIWIINSEIGFPVSAVQVKSPSAGLMDIERAGLYLFHGVTSGLHLYFRILHRFFLRASIQRTLYRAPYSRWVTDPFVLPLLKIKGALFICSIGKKDEMHTEYVYSLDHIKI